MDALFQTALSFRELIVRKIEKCDDELLDQVPEGFNNTIRWQIAHLIATPALLTYRLTGQESPLVNQEFLGSVCKGTCHESYSLNEDYGTPHLLEFLIETTKQLQRDYKNLKKTEFKPYETSTGFMIKDLDSAIAFSNVHDGIHIGQIGLYLKLLNT